MAKTAKILRKNVISIAFKLINFENKAVNPKIKTDAWTERSPSRWLFINIPKLRCPLMFLALFQSLRLSVLIINTPAETYFFGCFSVFD